MCGAIDATGGTSTGEWIALMVAIRDDHYGFPGADANTDIIE